MSFNCNITVQFEVSRTNVLKEVAQAHLERLKHMSETDHEDYDRDAHRFFEYMAEGKGVGNGPRGDMLTWGSVGNYSSIEDFMGAMRPFLFDLYDKGAIMPCDGAIVMFQQEQRPFVKIVEISNNRSFGKTVSLEIREGEFLFPLFGWYYERPEAHVPRVVSRYEWKNPAR